jgi:hypothetical protein
MTHAPKQLAGMPHTKASSSHHGQLPHAAAPTPARTSPVRNHRRHPRDRQPPGTSSTTRSPAVSRWADSLVALQSPPSRQRSGRRRSSPGSCRPRRTCRPSSSVRTLPRSSRPAGSTPVRGAPRTPVRAHPRNAPSIVSRIGRGPAAAALWRRCRDGRAVAAPPGAVGPAQCDYPSSST